MTTKNTAPSSAPCTSTSTSSFNPPSPSTSPSPSKSPPSSTSPSPSKSPSSSSTSLSGSSSNAPSSSNSPSNSSSPSLSHSPSPSPSTSTTSSSSTTSQEKSQITSTSDALTNTPPSIYGVVEGWMKKPAVGWFMTKKRVYIKLEVYQLKQYKSDGDSNALTTFQLTTNTTLYKSTGFTSCTLVIKDKVSKEKWAFEDEKFIIDKWYSEVYERLQTLKENIPEPNPNPKTNPDASSDLYNFRNQRFEGEDFILPHYYKPKRKLGSGAYGVVIAAQDARHRQRHMVGIKKCFKIFNSPLDAKKIAREIHLTKQFNHPCVLRLTTIVPPPNESFEDLYIVSELMDVDLHHLMHRGKNELTPDHIQWFLYQLVCAVHYLHSIDVMHRDIKPSNCLVNSNCELRLCDYGLARGTDTVDNELEANFSEYVVTRWYRAPEVILNPRKYNKALDMWSVGCLLAELLLKRPLFPASNYEQLLRQIVKTCGALNPDQLDFINKQRAKDFMMSLPNVPKKDYAAIFANVDPVCLDFLDSLLQIDPRKRLTAEEALQHPYFEDCRREEKEKIGTEKIEWNNLENLTLTSSDSGRNARQRLNRELREFILNDVVEMNPDAASLYRKLNLSRVSSRGA